MTAPTPRDTGPALDPRAVEAAAEALSECYEGAGGHDYRTAAEFAVTAAAPFLRAEAGAAERQRIAEAIRALIEPVPATGCKNGPGCPECLDGGALEAAARIAEAGP